jgi:hypothetical protein
MPSLFSRGDVKIVKVLNEMAPVSGGYFIDKVLRKTFHYTF